MALHLCTLLWDMYTLKQLYMWLINVFSVKIFICGFGLRFVILCKVHLCLSHRPQDLGRSLGARRTACGVGAQQGQVAMATDCSCQQTIPTGAAGSPIGCRDCEWRQGWSCGRSTIAQSTTEGQQSGKWRKGCRRMVEGYVRIMGTL